METTVSPNVEKSRMKLRIDQAIREKKAMIKLLEQDIEILNYGIETLNNSEVQDWKRSMRGTEIERILEVHHG